MEVRRIADQFKRAFEGDAWHGPPLRELLTDVDASAAASRPVEGAHSIWEILLHINAWERAAVELLDGGPGGLSDAEDWPPVAEASAAAWTAALSDLERDNEALRARIRELSDEDLGGKVEARPYSVYVLLHGVVQHGLYHAGQIGLLKRALETAAWTVAEDG